MKGWAWFPLLEVLFAGLALQQKNGESSNLKSRLLSNAGLHFVSKVPAIAEPGKLDR